MNRDGLRWCSTCHAYVQTSVISSQTVANIVVVPEREFCRRCGLYLSPVEDEIA